MRPTSARAGTTGRSARTWPGSSRTSTSRHTLAAAEKLPAFDKPVLLVWASEEKLFPLSLAERLAEKLPNASIVEIADSYTFIPEDKPAELAAHVIEFVTRVGA